MTGKNSWRKYIELVTVFIGCFVLSYGYAILMTSICNREASYPFDRRRYLAVLVCPIFIMMYYCLKHAVAAKDDTSFFVTDSANTLRPYRKYIDIILIIALPGILLWQYLSGRVTLVFLDMASDSFAQVYPQLLRYAIRIENGQLLGGYDFSKGLGHAESAIIPDISNWVSFFGKEYVAYLMGLSLYLKMALSGILMYGLTVLYKIPQAFRIVLALGYEFNSMFTIRGSWKSYPNIAFLIILWLFCFELAYRHEHKWVYIVPFAMATLLFFFWSDRYSRFLYGFIFFVYIASRFLSEKRRIVNLVIYEIIFAFFALFSFGFNPVGTLTSAMSSQRVSSGISSVAVDTQSVAVVQEVSRHIPHLNIDFDWGMLYEAFMRSIGQSICGGYLDFSGSYNILEGPTFYFGILLLLLVPVAFYNLRGIKRLLFGAGMIAAVLLIGIERFRRVVAGFTGISFKYTSFWITILLILLILEALERANADGFRQGSLLVYNITGVMVILLYLGILFSDKLANVREWIISLVFILVYIGVANLYKNHGGSMQVVLLMAVIAESLLVSWNVYNGEDRIALPKQDLDGKYFDPCYYAMKDTADRDPGWYRVERCPEDFTKANVTGVYGTADYVGGDGIGGGYRSFVEALGLPSDGPYRWIFGTTGNLYANSLVGVKYLYTRNPYDSYDMQYQYTYDGEDVYKNDLALPLGYVYDKAIGEDAFYSLSYFDRGRVLFNACLVQNSDNPYVTVADTEQSITPLTKGFYHKEDMADRLDVSEFSGNVLELHFQNYEQLENGSVSNISNAGKILWTDSEENQYYKYINEDGTVVLDASDISQIWLDELRMPKYDGLNISVYERDEYYRDTVSAIQNLRNCGLEISSIGTNEIKGHITTDSDGIFATSIPDSAWEVYIDGVRQRVYTVNAGFIGCDISKGEHEVRLSYSVRGTWISIYKWYLRGALALLSVLLITLIHDSLKRRKGIEIA